MSDPRPVPPFTGTEREVLCGFLDFHRTTLLMKCADLTPEQLARRSVSPSGLSLLGLVRHLADVERSWFSRVSKTPTDPIFYTEDELDLDFSAAVGQQSEVDLAFGHWHDQVARAREITATHDLDDTFEDPRHGTISLRWVLTHMVEEYARHNGHADLLREAIDGRTGE